VAVATFTSAPYRTLTSARVDDFTKTRYRHVAIGIRAWVAGQWIADEDRGRKRFGSLAWWHLLGV